VVADIYNPSLQSLRWEDLEFETNLGNIMRSGGGGKRERERERERE
jgi:hypothetical protein